MTIAEALAKAAVALRGASVAEARREAATLLLSLLGCDRTYLFTHDDEALTPEQVNLFRRWVARRAAGEPAQYVTGRQEFYGLDFEVTPAVLIPRPETELLIETALELLRGTSAPLVCDVGTGSGCIAITLLHERRDARAVAVDLSPAALRVAARNAARHGVAARLALVTADCFSALDPARAHFDLIASNPPYIAERDVPGLQREVRDHEPLLALTPGGDGLFVIRRLLADAPPFLASGGHLLVEIGHDQHAQVTELIDPLTWTLLGIQQDLQGIPRIVALRGS
ncbi:MAG: peptide chain release factor N(5)-glutamine methyltransferase [Pyrinomonadaceae bacterium]